MKNKTSQGTEFAITTNKWGIVIEFAWGFPVGVKQIRESAVCGSGLYIQYPSHRITNQECKEILLAVVQEFENEERN